MDKPSTIQQLGPYVVAVVSAIGTIIVAIVAPRSQRAREREARAFDTRLERARFMRLALARAEMAAARLADESTLKAAALGLVSADSVEGITDEAMHASREVRELAAMTTATDVTALLEESLVRLHNLVVGATAVSNMSKLGSRAEALAAAENHEVRRGEMIDGRGGAEGLRALAIAELWNRLRVACSQEFDSLTNDTPLERAK